MNKVIKTSTYKEPKAVLRFSSYAWSKLCWMRDAADTEISGFGIASEEDPLYIEDFITVKQKCTSVTTEMDDNSVADFFEEMFDKGIEPWRCGRVWIHTHPGMSPTPSGTDQATFNKVFGKCDWAVMFILATDDTYSCALQYNTGPKHRVPIEVEVMKDTFYEEWEVELETNVSKATPVVFAKGAYGYDYSYIDDEDYIYGTYGTSKKNHKESFMKAYENSIKNTKNNKDNYVLLDDEKSIREYYKKHANEELDSIDEFEDWADIGEKFEV